MGKNTIIGIDLGTSTTEAAVIRNGKPEMILNFSDAALPCQRIRIRISEGGDH